MLADYALEPTIIISGKYKNRNRLAKIQLRLYIRAAWSESSVDTLLMAKDPMLLYADNWDIDQTARMCRLIWVFLRHTC